MKRYLTVEGQIDDWVTKSFDALKDAGFFDVVKDNWAKTVSGSLDYDRIDVSFSVADGKVQMAVTGSEKICDVFKEIVGKLSDGKPVTPISSSAQETPVDTNQMNASDSNLDNNLLEKSSTASETSKNSAPNEKKKTKKAPFIIGGIILLIIIIMSISANGPGVSEKSLVGSWKSIADKSDLKDGYTYYISFISDGTVSFNIWNENKQTNSNYTGKYNISGENLHIYLDDSNSTEYNWIPKQEGGTLICTQKDDDGTYTFTFEKSDEPVPTTAPTPTPVPTPKVTLSQQNALSSAKSYLIFLHSLIQD